MTYDDEYGYTPYNVMLNVSDIGTGVNKFYRMQVIKMKGKKSYYFWINWGRVGTDVGDNRKYQKGSEKSAIEQFVEKFELQTGVHEILLVPSFPSLLPSSSILFSRAPSHHRKQLGRPPAF